MSITITITSENNDEIVSISKALRGAYPDVVPIIETLNPKALKMKAKIIKKSDKSYKKTKPKHKTSELTAPEAKKWIQHDVLPDAYRPVIKALYTTGGQMTSESLSQAVGLGHHKLIGIIGNMTQRAKSALPEFKRGSPSVIRMKDGVVTMSKGLSTALDELPVDVGRDW